MSQPPPLLPDVVLGRVVRVARMDGGGALLLGGIFALMMAAAGDRAFAVVGLLAAGSGAIELHGAALLRRGEPRGMRWLIASQPLLLAVIWSYCVLRIAAVQAPPIPETLRPFLAASAAPWQVTVEEYVQALNRLTIATLALVALGFQGGLTLYYMRRRRAVERALGEPFRFGGGTTNRHE
jgi:hypothetical protein